MQLVLAISVIDINRLPFIRSSGFESVEVSDSATLNLPQLDEIIRISQDCGLEIRNWHLSGKSPFVQIESQSREAIDGMKCSMDRGARTGAKKHVLHWLQRFLDPKCDSLWRNATDQWVQHADSLGVRLLMETVPDKPRNERYVPSREIIEFVNNYPAHLMGICLDVNHSNLKEDLPSVVRIIRRRLASLHISDNDGKSEKHWLPGQGVIDFPGLFNALRNINFAGDFVLEVTASCDQPDSPEELAKLFQYANTLFTTGMPDPDTPPVANSHRA